jgi:hypothetical protein
VAPSSSGEIRNYLVVDDAVVLAAGMFIVVSIAAGAGAIAGAEVSAVAASSFLEVHAASARTAATRARRFIYDLLERQTWINSPAVHAVAVPVFGAGENLSHPEPVSRAMAAIWPLARAID